MKKNKKCEGCGGNLIFSPLSQSLICENCSKLHKIEFDKNILKHNLTNDILANHSSNFDSETTNCPSCGASVNTKGLEYSTNCPYCDSSIVLEHKNESYKVDAIVPFSIDKSKVFETYKEKIKKKWFLPNTFKKHTKAENIEGFYIPAFGFDCETKSSYNGVLEEAKRDSDGDTYYVRKRISGNKNINFVNELVESSTKLNQLELKNILPYNLGESVKFDNDFIRGYSVEHFNNTLQNCFNLARNNIKSQIENHILGGYNYSSVVSLNVNTIYSNEKYCYNLLPVYKIDFIFKHKNYSTFMNGQTGKVGTGLPKSKVKITFFTLAIIAIFIGIFLLCYFTG